MEDDAPRQVVFDVARERGRGATVHGRAVLPNRLDRFALQCVVQVQSVVLQLAIHADRRHAVQLKEALACLDDAVRTVGDPQINETTVFGILVRTQAGAVVKLNREHQVGDRHAAPNAEPGSDGLEGAAQAGEQASSRFLQTAPHWLRKDTVAGNASSLHREANTHLLLNCSRGL